VTGSALPYNPISIVDMYVGQWTLPTIWSRVGSKGGAPNPHGRHASLHFSIFFDVALYLLMMLRCIY